MTQIKSGSAVPADTGIAKIVYIDPTTGEVQESASTTKIQSAAFQTATYELDDTLLGILQDPASVYSPGPSTLSSRSATGTPGSTGSIRAPFGSGFSVPTVSGTFNRVAVPFTSQANDSTSMVLKVYGSADGNPSNSKTLLATAPALLGSQGGTFASKETLVPLGVDLTVSSGTYAFLFFDLEFSGSLSNPNEWDGPYAGAGTASVTSYSSTSGGTTWVGATPLDLAFSLDYDVLSSVDKVIQANGSGRLDQSFLQYNINFGSHKLSGVTDPTSAQDAATKNYVDTRTLDDLSDVIITSPSSGQVLQWDGTDWVNGSSLPAIGETITGATAGSVLFAGASGVLAQDNAKLFWDDSAFKLGVGKTPGSFNLDVQATSDSGLAVTNSTSSQVASVVVFNDVGNYSLINTTGSTTASPDVGIFATTCTGGLALTSYDASASLRLGTAGAERVRITSTGNVGIGTTAPSELLTVGASHFTVNSSGDITTIRDVTYSWPSAQASQVGQVLSNDGSGNLSWGTVYPQYTIGNAVVVGSPVYVSSANTVSLFDQTSAGLTNEIPGLSMVAGSSGNTTLAFNGTKLSGIASALAGSPTGGAFAAGQRLFVNRAGKLDNAMPTGPSGLVVWQAGILVDSGTIMQVSIKQVKVIS